MGARRRVVVAALIVATAVISGASVRAQDAAAGDEDWEDWEDWIDELDDVPLDEPALSLADPALDWRAPPPVTWGLEVAGILWRPSLEIRARSETRLGAYRGPAEQSIVTSRARVGLEARWQSLRALVQVQDARDFGVTPGAPTGATTGVHQGFLEIGDGRSFVRLGRQEIDWGGSRLIGSLNWQSSARSFDALRMRGELHQLAVEGLVIVTRMPRRIEAGWLSVDSEGDWVAGLALEWNEGDVLRVATHMLYRHDGPTEPRASATRRQTHGAILRQQDIVAWSLRAAGRVQRVHYELEAIGEVGAITGLGFLALGAIAEVGYTFDVAWQPDVALGVTYGSGSTGPDGTLDEFDNFFPSNHAVYGLMDLFGLRNQAHTYLRVAATPDSTLNGWLAARLFWLAESGARWSDAGGQTIGVSPSNREPFLGGELDVELRWTPIEHVAVSVGYGIFIPAAGAAALSHPDPMQFLYVMAGLSF